MTTSYQSYPLILCIRLWAFILLITISHSLLKGIGHRLKEPHEIEKATEITDCQFITPNNYESASEENLNISINNESSPDIQPVDTFKSANPKAHALNRDGNIIHGINIAISHSDITNKSTTNTSKNDQSPVHEHTKSYQSIVNGYPQNINNDLPSIKLSQSLLLSSNNNVPNLNTQDAIPQHVSNTIAPNLNSTYTSPNKSTHPTTSKSNLPLIQCGACNKSNLNTNNTISHSNNVNNDELAHELLNNTTHPNASNSNIPLIQYDILFL